MPSIPSPMVTSPAPASRAIAARLLTTSGFVDWEPRKERFGFMSTRSPLATNLSIPPRSSTAPLAFSPASFPLTMLTLGLVMGLKNLPSLPRGRASQRQNFFRVQSRRACYFPVKIWRSRSKKSALCSISMSIRASSSPLSNHMPSHPSQKSS